jgi:hypothetical protein
MPALAEFFKFQLRAGPTTKCLLLCNIFGKCSTSRGGINREQRKSLTGPPGQPWLITGPEMAVQAKFGQYLQDTKDPMLISQTEKAVEWEQVSSKEQVLPMPVFHQRFIAPIMKNRTLSIIIFAKNNCE